MVFLYDWLVFSKCECLSVEWARRKLRVEINLEVDYVVIRDSKDFIWF
ncbi:MAG: hypothetical protein ACI8Q3_001583 [Marinomonas primoryensis]|jgi:hypothetical protein